MQSNLLFFPFYIIQNVSTFSIYCSTEISMYTVHVSLDYTHVRRPICISFWISIHHIMVKENVKRCYIGFKNHWGPVTMKGLTPPQNKKPKKLWRLHLLNTYIILTPLHPHHPKKKSNKVHNLKKCHQCLPYSLKILARIYLSRHEPSKRSRTTKNKHLPCL